MSLKTEEPAAFTLVGYGVTAGRQHVWNFVMVLANEFGSDRLRVFPQQQIECKPAKTPGLLRQMADLLASAKMQFHATNARRTSIEERAPNAQTFQFGGNLRGKKFPAHFVVRKSRFINQADGATFKPCGDGCRGSGRATAEDRDFTRNRRHQSL